MKNFSAGCTLNSLLCFYEQARYLSPTFLSKVRLKKNVWILLEVYIISPCKIAQPFTLFLLIYSNLPKMFQKGAFLNCPALVTIQWLRKSNSKKFLLIKAVLTYREKRHVTSRSSWQDFGQGRSWWEGRAFHVWAESPLSWRLVQGSVHSVGFLLFAAPCSWWCMLHQGKMNRNVGAGSMAGMCVNHHRYTVQHEETARLSPLLLNEMDYTDIAKLGRKNFVRSSTEDKLRCTS